MCASTGDRRKNCSVIVGRYLNSGVHEAPWIIRWRIARERVGLRSRDKRNEREKKASRGGELHVGMSPPSALSAITHVSPDQRTDRLT